jgi:2-polyprenyl-3-methyl-5-hydroxy-6-metoxy-1,4-benzoquinol methylase
MTRRDQTIGADYFDRLYLERDDPWEFETSAYEREKYAATLALLSAAPYARALEVGCSIGVLTAQLAKRCVNLLAIDASDVALSRARARNPTETVQFERRMVPADFPDGQFDLIVLSEVLYCMTETDLATLAEQCAAALTPGGEIIMCHWLGETDYPLTGAHASDYFADAIKRRCQTRLIANDRIYRLERLSA